MWARFGSVWLVGLCVLFTLALRTPFLTWPLLQDEAGLLIIAEQWREGPFLYGDYFVGRGVVLLLIFTLADALGGPVALRLLGCVAAASLVVAAGWAGHRLGGRAAAGWSAAVAASYASTYAFASQVMNERLVAAALVTVSCACMLAVVGKPYPSRRGTELAVLSGMTATAALLVVQSYAGGLAFAGVLVAVSWRTRELSGSEAVRIAAAGVLGALLPVAALAAAVLVSWPTAAQVWFQMFGYRISAVPVLGADLPLDRMAVTLAIAGVTGVLLLVLCFLLGRRGVGTRPVMVPAWWAVLAMLPVAGAGMILGGGWYADYLLELVPASVLGTALVAGQATRAGAGMRLGAVLAVVTAVVATFFALQQPILGSPAGETTFGRWLAAGAEEDDTAVVLWGNANLLHAAGMTSPYPYLWGLLTQTLDPDLDLMQSTLRGPDAPTWIVQWHDVDTWKVADPNALDEVIAERYRLVGSPCGIEVYLLRTQQREVDSSTLCADAG